MPRFSSRNQPDDIIIIPYLTREVYETIPGNNDGNRSTSVILKAGSLRRLSLPGDDDSTSGVSQTNVHGQAAGDVIKNNSDDDDDDDNNRPIITRSRSRQPSDEFSKSRSRSRLPGLLPEGAGVRLPQPNRYLPSTREIVRDAKKWAEEERQKEVRCGN